MANYVVYVNADQLASGMEQLVANTFARYGFLRAMRRGPQAAPLATLLFVGESSYDEIKLTRHLEKALRSATLRETDILVFRLDMRRHRHAVIAPPVPLSLTPKNFN